MSERKILIELDLDGDVRGFVVDGGEEHVIQQDGAARAYIQGAWLSELPARIAPIFGGSVGSPSVRLSLELAALDLWSLRDRVHAQLIAARIYWWPVGEVLHPRHEIFRGVVRTPDWQLAVDGAGRQAGRVDFSLEPPVLTGDKTFPPSLIGDEGRFPFASDDIAGRAVPVVYGSARGLELFPVSDVTADPIRLLVSGHPALGLIRVTDAQDDTPYGATQGAQEAVDGLGATYSYVTISLANYGLSSGQFYAPTVVGWTRPDGNPILGLGDVLIHAWTTYAGERFFDLDRERAWAARTRLNRFSIGSIFNEQVRDGTIVRALAGRYGEQFPVVFGYEGGRFGWDAAVFPGQDELEPIRTLTYGQDAFHRVGPTETSAAEIVTSFKLAYGIDGHATTTTASLTFDHTNSGDARRAHARWGETETLRLEAPDTANAATAYALLTDVARKRSRVRYRVEYADIDPEWYDLPLWEVVAVTDRELGWVLEPCIIEALQPQPNGRARAVLVSVDGA